MTITVHALTERPLSVAAAAMERGFEGYVIPMRCTPELLARRIRQEHIYPELSSVIEFDGAPAGILLVARRGCTSRIAALGLAPALRGRGLGASIMQDAITSARQRGDERLILEVIASNHPAIALYEGLGFIVSRRLVGYQRPAELGGDAHEGLAGCDPATAAQLIARWSAADLPWQLSASSLAGAAQPLQGFVIADQAAALVDASGTDVRLAGLAVRPAHRWRGLGSALLSALHHRFAGRSWTIPAIVPSGIHDEFLLRAGWRPQTISQFEMGLAFEENISWGTKVDLCHA